jgi:biopolymer transport protein ExbB
MEGQVTHDLERYLTALGIIASVAPLLGLLGTVVGMIDVFSALMLEGAGNANVLAGGISTALITTAAGLSVAIPALIFHRFLLRRVDELVVGIEQESAKLVDIMHGGQDDPRL